MCCFHTRLVRLLRPRHSMLALIIRVLLNAIIRPFGCKPLPPLRLMLTLLRLVEIVVQLRLALVGQRQPTLPVPPPLLTLHHKPIMAATAAQVPTIRQVQAAAVVPAVLPEWVASAVHVPVLRSVVAAAVRAMVAATAPLPAESMVALGVEPAAVAVARLPAAGPAEPEPAVAAVGG